MPLTSPGCSSPIKCGLEHFQGRGSHSYGQTENRKTLIFSRKRSRFGVCADLGRGMLTPYYLSHTAVGLQSNRAEHPSLLPTRCARSSSQILFPGITETLLLPRRELFRSRQPCTPRVPWHSRRFLPHNDARRCMKLHQLTKKEGKTSLGLPRELQRVSHSTFVPALISHRDVSVLSASRCWKLGFRRLRVRKRMLSSTQPLHALVHTQLAWKQANRRHKRCSDALPSSDQIKGEVTTWKSG